MLQGDAVVPASLLLLLDLILADPQHHLGEALVGPVGAAPGADFFGHLFVRQLLALGPGPQQLLQALQGLSFYICPASMYSFVVASLYNCQDQGPI